MSHIICNCPQIMKYMTVVNHTWSNWLNSFSNALILISNSCLVNTTGMVSCGHITNSEGSFELSVAILLFGVFAL